MAFLNNIEQLRAVDWGAKYLWDVQFSPAAPSPFNTWFPAVDVEENVANLESLTIEAHIHTFKVPQRTSVKEIRLTFYDDSKNTLLTWLKDWMAGEASGSSGIIANGGKYVRAVSSITRQLQVIKLNRKREQVSTAVYQVYPETALTFAGSSASDVHMYTVPFVVVGSDAKF